MSDGNAVVGYIARRNYLLLCGRVAGNIRGKFKAYHADLVRERRYWRRYRFDHDILTNCSRLSVRVLATDGQQL